jgi:hypothetical protein
VVTPTLPSVVERPPTRAVIARAAGGPPPSRTLIVPANNLQLDFLSGGLGRNRSPGRVALVVVDVATDDGDVEELRFPNDARDVRVPGRRRVDPLNRAWPMLTVDDQGIAEQQNLGPGIARDGDEPLCLLSIEHTGSARVDAHDSEAVGVDDVVRAWLLRPTERLCAPLLVRLDERTPRRRRREPVNARHPLAPVVTTQAKRCWGRGSASQKWNMNPERRSYQSWFAGTP